MKRKYFKKCDLIIYIFIMFIWSNLLLKIFSTSNEVASKVEIYVDSKLKNVYSLKEDRKELIDTGLGGVRIEIKDSKVRAISSNSPLKLIVKQGWIDKPGETLIGIPDKMLVKVIGKNKEDEEEIDFILR